MLLRRACYSETDLPAILLRKKSRQRIAGNLNNATVRRVSGLWHHDWDSFVEVMMEWWVIAVELGVPVIIGLAIYLTLRK